MNMRAILELKKQYERELIRAEAKVAVITDIIETCEPCECRENTEPATTYEQTEIPDMEIPTNPSIENY